MNFKSNREFETPASLPLRHAYRIDDACRELGIGRTSIYQLLSEQKIRSAIIAGRRVIPGSEIKRLLDESMTFAA